jgi:hypothetical protein
VQFRTADRDRALDLPASVLTTVRAIRSATVGIPMGRVPPLSFGISTCRAGGREVADRDHGNGEGRGTENRDVPYGAQFIGARIRTATPASEFLSD